MSHSTLESYLGVDKREGLVRIGKRLLRGTSCPYVISGSLISFLHRNRDGSGQCVMAEVLPRTGYRFSGRRGECHGLVSIYAVFTSHNCRPQATRERDVEQWCRSHCVLHLEVRCLMKLETHGDCRYSSTIALRSSQERVSSS